MERRGIEACLHEATRRYDQVTSALILHAVYKPMKLRVPRKKWHPRLRQTDYQLLKSRKTPLL